MARDTQRRLENLYKGPTVDTDLFVYRNEPFNGTTKTATVKYSIALIGGGRAGYARDAYLYGGS